MIDGVVEAATAGATLAAGAAIWLLVGYLIQRFAFGNPEPTYGTVLATSLSLMLLFLLVSQVLHPSSNDASLVVISPWRLRRCALLRLVKSATRSFSRSLAKPSV